ncbi:lysozyme inhibitor LprI family protein [Microcoleus sp. A006_D1]|uniref:lysozyme inhibitor LprI family protein n=1 Tax=Microcoleus sp. A006_D1 TaxID=3055267 RepID=UPI002FD20165
MKKRSLFRLIISLIFLSTSSSVVFGQGRSSSASEPAVCNQPQTQTEISNCAAALYKQADRLLNEVYKQVISKLNRREREKLIDEQLGWIRRRDPTCKNKVLSTNRIDERGSLYPTYLNGCLETLTQQRTAELEKYLQK